MVSESPDWATPAKPRLGKPGDDVCQFERSAGLLLKSLCAKLLRSEPQGPALSITCDMDHMRYGGPDYARDYAWAYVDTRHA